MSNEKQSVEGPASLGEAPKPIVAVEPTQPPVEPRISFKEFLERVPPSEQRTVHGAAGYEGPNRNTYLTFPSLELFCNHPSCRGIRFFDAENVYLGTEKAGKLVFGEYVCRNCAATKKTYALRARVNGDRSCDVFKFGEDFPFGDPLSPKLLDLFGDEAIYFKKGYQAEKAGLGIAAFAYYRRVVENKKSEIIERFIKVAEMVGAPDEMISDLKLAAKETQFTKAIGTIKHGIPESLKIAGHNPLSLLHDSLSDGLHVQEDEHCLTLATSIRIVLGDLVARIQSMLKDDSGLKNAVAKLLEVQRAKASPKPQGGTVS